MTLITGQVNLGEVRKTVFRFIEDVALHHRVTEALKCGARLVTKACELWDYKEEAKSDAVSLAEIVVDIVSSHNAYRGYSLYIVEEAGSDLEFITVRMRQRSLTRIN